MEIIIEETGELQQLSVMCPRTGEDLAYRFINDTTGLSHWEKNKEGSFIVKRTEYNWWSEILNKEQRVANLLSENAELMTNDIFREIWHAETCALEHFTDIKLSILERVTEGSISAKVKSIKEAGQLRISKDTCVVNYTVDDDKHFIDCEGIFILNTAANKYEIPIGTASSYVNGDDYMTLDGVLDCPINLSDSQAKVVYDTLFSAIKKELGEAGVSGVNRYKLEE